MPVLVWRRLSTSTTITTLDIVTGRPRVGRVTIVVPERRLDFTWWPADDPDQQSSVSITLTPNPSDEAQPCTTIRVVEEPNMSTSTTVSARHSTGGAWAWRTALLGLVGVGVGVRAGGRA